mmetsp:Transcript_9984/g.15095  ORF Transcript_9984/g.15095 Transcript_9984/m.15095 type:complete len:551 (+) Transcript_9984:39-1691(+)
MDQQINSGAPASKEHTKEEMKNLANEYMGLDETQKRVRTMAGKGNRLTLNLDEVRHFNPRLASYIVRNPLSAIQIFEDQLNQAVRQMQEDSGKQNSEKTAQTGDANFPKKVQNYYINFDGNFGKNYVTPRGLKSNLVNNLVQVQGIVTKMNIVRPMIQTSIHYCEQTKKGLVKHYNDKHNLAKLADAEGTGDNNAFPTKDQNDNPLSTEFGYCVYKDSQIITIQELPENAPPGQLPRSVNVVLENDLVDSCKPGDRVLVTGVYRVNHTIDGNFKTELVAVGVKSLLAEKEKPIMSEEDLKNIRKLAKNKDSFNILGESIAPSIEGCLMAKKSILLQLLGGTEKVLNNGTHLRGDINIMMVGDPSTAKSQLLRHVMDIAPLALNTTGRGSSGVGLTAAVSFDKLSGERTLEAGAMVLADRGIVCIDEFDKMNDIDRVAIHEVMEQQTVTIAKAGIHTTLNARCSVIAAANPIYSEYARDQSVGKNIGLPDSLLSRFDLLFIMLDEKDPENDRKIAERVITNHRFQSNTGDQQTHFNFQNEDFVIEPDAKDR